MQFSVSVEWVHDSVEPPASVRLLSYCNRNLRENRVARLLLVDDEETLLVSLGYSLRRAGHEVTTASDGISALQRLEGERFDLLLLDLMLPRLDGMELCRLIRRHSDLPIIMLTAREGVEDRVAGLTGGADDYVTKPFSTQELLARIEAVLRRGERRAREVAAPPRASNAPAVGRFPGYRNPDRGESGRDAAQPLPVVRTGILEVSGIRMDLDRYEVTVDQQPISLAPKEFQLLQTLMSFRGRVLSRGELIATVWGDDFMGGAKTLDVHMRWLRAKVERDPAQPRYIVTVRGVGFRFN